MYFDYSFNLGGAGFNQFYQFTKGLSQLYDTRHCNKALEHRKQSCDTHTAQPQWKNNNNHQICKDIENSAYFVNQGVNVALFCYTLLKMCFLA